MLRTWVLCCLLIIGIPGFGQHLIIRDQSTHQPIGLVALQSLNPQATSLTNDSGQADISAFKGSAEITIRVLGYTSEKYSWKQLESMKFIVYLERSVISLGEVVVAASRWEQDKRDVPNAIAKVSAADIQLQNPQTAADLLASSGMVFMQKSQMGGGSPMIRGFATNRVLIDVDGVRMNTAIFRSGNVQNVISVDPLAVEQTEIVFGPGSVIYGSDAIGGVMGFKTLTPKLTTNGKPLIKGQAFTRWSSANMEKTGHFDLNIGLKKWGFVTSLSYTDYDDLMMGSNGPEEYLRPEYVQFIDGKDSIVANANPRKQVSSGYTQYNLMQKIRFRPNEYWDIQYGFHYSATGDYPRYDRLIEYKSGKLRDGVWYYGPQKWMLNSLSVVNSKTNAMYDKARITLAHQAFEESRHNRSFGKSALAHRKENVTVISANIDFDKKVGTKQELFYGVEALLNQVGSEGLDENIKTGESVPGSTRYPDGSTWNSFAVYATDHIRLNEKLTVQAGMRYSYVMLRADFDTTFFPFPFTTAVMNTGALNGSMGLAYKPTSDWQFNLNFSTGFRAPNIDDVGKVFESQPGAVVVPNPDLVPEYAYNAEIGVARIIGEYVKVDVTGYYTYLDNALVRRDFQLNGLDSIVYDGDMSRVQAIQNAAFAYVYGVQAGLDVKLPVGFGISSKFTWQQGEEELDDGSTAPLRHAGPWFGATHLTWSRNRLKADLYGVYNGKITNENMAPSEQAKVFIYAKDENGNPWSPAWYTLNFKMMYQVTDFLTITAGLENITDQRYRPYSSGIVAAGRNVILSLRGTF
ncbi:MAG TPA: TonB-dependent receptor [Bacteroidales bacterium]|nr:TonB-dependent receptor [Bacteroidales bacterium]